MGAIEIFVVPQGTEVEEIIQRGLDKRRKIRMLTDESNGIVDWNYDYEVVAGKWRFGEEGEKSRKVECKNERDGGWECDEDKLKGGKILNSYAKHELKKHNYDFISIILDVRKNLSIHDTNFYHYWTQHINICLIFYLFLFLGVSCWIVEKGTGQERCIQLVLIKVWNHLL